VTEAVFVYGTLTDAERARSLLDDFDFLGSATLEGLHRVAGAYPTLAPGGRVEGRILVTDDLASLDRYEGVADGLYVRVAVPVVDSGGAVGGLGESDGVWVYVGDPDALGEAVDWPGSGGFAERVRRYVSDQGVRVDFAG
jgi:gamma-glutamylcyclotransferase (GGCT)/AIG2-like uncharacterized protein YtfP